MEMIRVSLIGLVILFFVIQMIRKKVSTIIALPAMGVLVALIASAGTSEVDFLSLFSYPSIDPDTGVAIVDEAGVAVMTPGIMSGVISEGTKMMASAISSAIFGAALAVMLKKLGVIEQLVKMIAELAGDKPMVIAVSFFAVTTLIFAAIGGLGPIILIGTVALPIMMSAGISPRDSGAMILLGISAGGIINPANWATMTAIMTSTGMEQTQAYNMVVDMAFKNFGIVFIISLLFVIFAVKSSSYSRGWAKPVNRVSKKVPKALLIAPIVPIVIIFGSTIMANINPSYEILSPEIAITLAIGYVCIFAKGYDRGQLVTASFVEGVKEVAGAIVLLVGLGILIKGFQYPTVTPLITPITSGLVSVLTNPLAYVIGFTIATPLVLYRGPLNTFGIGGSIPAIFAASGFNPLATVYVLSAVGNLQGFGDPTNSQNIWIADFVKVEPMEITKRVLLLGFIITFSVLTIAVLTIPDLLVTI